MDQSSTTTTTQAPIATTPAPTTRLYEKKYTVEKVREGTLIVISSNNFYFKRLENNTMQIQYSINNGKYTPFIDIVVNQLTGKNYTILIPTNNENESEFYYLIGDLKLVLSDAVSKSYISEEQKFVFSPAINTFNSILPPADIGPRYTKIVKEIKPDPVDPNNPNNPVVKSSSVWKIIGIVIGIVIGVLLLLLIVLYFYRKKNSDNRYIELSIYPNHQSAPVA